MGLTNRTTGDCNWEYAIPTKHCLIREYDENNFSTYYDHFSIDTILKRAKVISYDEFRRVIENAPHGIVHTSIGGRNGDMTHMRSPNDPIFWLHHSFIDKIYHDYQILAGDALKYDGENPDGKKVSTKDILAPFKWTVGDASKVDYFCYQYQPFSKQKGPADLIAKLADALPVKAEHAKIPDPISDDVIAAHHWNVDEMRESEKVLGDLMASENNSTVIQIESAKILLFFSVFLFFLQ